MMMVALLLAVQPTAAPSLDLFKPVVGSCWRTEFSSTMHDTHCFEAMYGGAHVRDRHEVQQNGKTVYAGETIYSADGSELVFTYVNSLGGIGRGTVEPQAAGLKFAGSMRGSPGDRSQPVAGEWRFTSADSYQVRSEGSPVRTFRRVP